MLQKKFPILGSSQDPKKLKLRVQTVLVALVPVAMYFSGLFGYDIGEELWHQLIEMVVDGGYYGALLYATCGHIYGWFRALKK